MSGSTASSAPRPISGIPTSCTTTIRSSRPTNRRRAITSPRTSRTRRSRSSGTPRQSRPRNRSSCTTRQALAMRPTKRRESGSTSTRDASTPGTRRCARRRSSARSGSAWSRTTPSCRRSTRSARRRPGPGRTASLSPPSTSHDHGTRYPTTRSACSPGWLRSTPGSSPTPITRSGAFSITSRTQTSSRTR